eukprot:TRINITY_DN8823_c0_g1_i1.p1 TRINITY_DN8823_c0_g1~~TRINITY_DN8823_c0_g1_i1.p1  ORF type:complete len:118 (+),score=15.00 TRINITY_DN8823_c0_g1_i1:60-413(+)
MSDGYPIKITKSTAMSTSRNQKHSKHQPHESDQSKKSEHIIETKPKQQTTKPELVGYIQERQLQSENELLSQKIHTAHVNLVSTIGNLSELSTQRVAGVKTNADTPNDIPTTVRVKK